MQFNVEWLKKWVAVDLDARGGGLEGLGPQRDPLVDVHGPAHGQLGPRVLRDVALRVLARSRVLGWRRASVPDQSPRKRGKNCKGGRDRGPLS